MNTSRKWGIKVGIGISTQDWLVAESIGGVSPVGWTGSATILIDTALNDYDVVWAAAGHPHAVYPTTCDELIRCTGARPVFVGE